MNNNDFNFTIEQDHLITKFSLGNDAILFETTQDYEDIQTLSKWLQNMYDEIQKLRIEKQYLENKLKEIKSDDR